MTNKKVLIAFGTRPEIIKLYPIIKELEKYKNINVVLVNTGQQLQLADSFIDQFKIKPKYNLGIMRPDQSLNYVAYQVIDYLDRIIKQEKPNLAIVQGDTTTAMAAAIASFNCKIPIAHVEAGLRTHHRYNPFPEEMNRTLISQLATYHFCPTIYNETHIHRELFEPESIFSWVTGNTSIDIVKSIKPIIQKEDNIKQILLTLHRRENLESGKAVEYLHQLESFLLFNYRVKCKWVIHPNSNLKESCTTHNCFKFINPLPYNEFIRECYNSDLILSDSGGIQEEITVIKKPLFILRETTERPEVLKLPFVKLIKDPPQLEKELTLWFDSKPVDYSKEEYGIFGKGDSGYKIAKIVATKILK